MVRKRKKAYVGRQVCKERTEVEEVEERTERWIVWDFVQVRNMNFILSGKGNTVKC